MAIKLIESFDLNNADLVGGDRWTTAAQATLVTASPTPRTGVNCLQLQDNGNLTKQFSDNQATYILHFGLYLTSFPGGTYMLAQFMDTTSYQVELRLTQAGALQVTRNGTQLGISANGLITLNAWLWIEWKVLCDPAAGTVDVRLAQTNILSLTAQNTRNTANSSFNRLALTGFSGSGVFHWYDDVILLDGSGASHNDFLGDRTVRAQVVNAAGHYQQFTPNASTNLSRVNQVNEDGDTTYISDSTVGDIDSYTFAAPAGTITVEALQMVTVARKTDAGTRDLAFNYRHGASDVAGTAKHLSQSYQVFTEIKETNPGTSVAWTQADISADDFGCKVAA